MNQTSINIDFFICAFHAALIWAGAFMVKIAEERGHFIAGILLIIVALFFLVLWTIELFTQMRIIK